MSLDTFADACRRGDPVTSGLVAVASVLPEWLTLDLRSGVIVGAVAWIALILTSMVLRRVVLLAPVGEISTTELRTMARDVGGLEVALIKGQSPPAGASLVSRRSSRRSTSSA